MMRERDMSRGQFSRRHDFLFMNSVLGSMILLLSTCSTLKKKQNRTVVQRVLYDCTVNKCAFFCRLTTTAYLPSKFKVQYNLTLATHQTIPRAFFCLLSTMEATTLRLMSAEGHNSNNKAILLLVLSKYLLRTTAESTAS